MKLVNCTSTSGKRIKRISLVVLIILMINQPPARSLIYFNSGRKKARNLHDFKPDTDTKPCIRLALKQAQRHLTLRYNLHYASNGSRRIMVSVRSGPVEMISIGTPVSSSIRLT
ncbi:hypothetical protein E5284_20815 [Citrobacter freundii]|nr:hypothetical protein E5284_20815 [Citrobacter freundii]RFU92385.1 hypothetical protein DZA29_08245 [Citrobacter gillenii]